MLALDHLSTFDTICSRLASRLGLGMAVVLFSTGSAPAAHQVEPAPDPEPVADFSDPAWTQPLFGTGLKTNNNYTNGNVFFTAPLWSTLGKGGTLGGDYLFLEPYASDGSHGEVATSLGFSWRHLFSDEPRSGLEKKGGAGFMEEGWFAGANVFVDMLDTQHRNDFWQMGVGGEVGARYIELRGNYYIPMTGDKLYERDVKSSQSFTSSASSTTM